MAHPLPSLDRIVTFIDVIALGVVGSLESTRGYVGLTGVLLA